jgi:hypothetical protein
MDYNHISYTRCKEIILEREYIIGCLFPKELQIAEQCKNFFSEKLRVAGWQTFSIS